MKFRIALLCTLLSAYGSRADAQELTVTGRVTNNNEPVSGATVTVKGTKTATTTDARGNYTISVPRPGAVISVTHVGMEPQEQTISAAGTHNYNLTGLTGSMNEVVVVGYGQQRKAVTTGSISSVKADQLQNVSNVRVEQTLQGRVSGVTVLPTSGQPGAGLSVRIRGTGSNRGSDPIYIVDGVRMGGLESIDPSDIQSVDILKDAASAAIYGAEAGNGVILITTKAGKNNARPVISYTGQYTQQSLKPGFIKMMDAQQYAQYLNEAGVAGAPSMIDVAGMGAGTNWLDEVLRRAPQQHHSLSVSGANDRGNYYVSGNIFSADGIVGGANSFFKRYTARFNGDYKVKEWMNMGVRFTYINHQRSAISENNEFGSILSSALVMDPTTPVTYNDPNNYPAHVQGYFDPSFVTANGTPVSSLLLYDAQGRLYGLSNYLKGEYANPVARIENQHGKNTQNKIQGSAYIELMPINGLKFTSRFGIDNAFQNGHGWNPRYWFSSESLAEKSGGYDYYDNWNYWQLENFATYNRRVGGHNFTVLAGASQQKWHEYHMGGSYTGLFREEERFSYGSFNGTVNNASIGSGITDYTLASFFGRLNYEFENKYLFMASVRRDGTSKAAPGKEWKTYPGVSAGWVFSNENFLTGRVKNILNYGKLRASWGQVGSVSSLGVGEWMNKVVPSGFYYDPNNTALQGAAPGSLPNPELTWETSEQLNVGMDLSFLNNRLTLTVDRYKKTTKDLLTGGTVPLYVGNFISTVNAGNVVNKGWDVDLNFRQPARKSRGFSWSVGGNFSTVDNKVTYLDPNSPIINGAGIGTGWTASAIQVGYPIWYFQGYKTDGIFQNQAQVTEYLAKNHITGYTPKPGEPVVVDVNGDGQINSSDMTYIGSPHAKFIFGLNTHLEFKGFDLNVLAQGQTGNQVLMGFNRTDRPTANKPAFFFNNRWTGEGSTNTWFAANTSNDKIYNSDLMVFDGDFMRIRQLQLGYTFNPSLLRRAGMSSARIYVSLDDYFTFTKYPGVDPEVGNNGGASIGIDRGGYPIPRKATVGVNLSF
ncbi:TonB-dependent receptor [Flaviaesturariibacter flavus]|uniref:TonB-dependent receptor n=1 Tax=Flaviaesturariibacter flavus TaxID=2502780 RepID=A0A4R1BB83_9BACT|nr:TonB-dependent receptor [Flaviaesturariibacter flavus]TCJ14239.1 TonB-dependent receptor [Flaviaesturariibacter flavus]